MIMNTKNIAALEESCHWMLIQGIMECVRENGEEMSDYFYNEYGMYEEDEEDVKIVKVLDVSDPGCFFSKQIDVNDDDVRRLAESDGIEEAADSCFSHYSIWALYIVREADGSERLKYYMFVNGGINFDMDESQPDHDYVDTLTLADLYYIIEALKKNNQK